MKNVIGLINFSIVFFASIPLVQSQSFPNYRTNLKMGKFAVGFKSLCIFDTSRQYDLTCGDSTFVIKNKNLGRPILMNIWYPARTINDTSVMKIKDYFNFPADENTNLFFKNLNEYQWKNSKLYSTDENIRKEDFAGNISLYEEAKKSVFENYIFSNTLSHKNAKEETGEFPVIIYHQGLGGTIDENSLLLEYLASNGIIVINSAFQNSDASWTMGVGDQQASLQDLNFIINYCKKAYTAKIKNFFLMGLTCQLVF